MMIITIIRVKAWAWDVAVPETYAVSRTQSTALEASNAAKHAAKTKMHKIPGT